MHDNIRLWWDKLAHVLIQLVIKINDRDSSVIPGSSLTVDTRCTTKRRDFMHKCMTNAAICVSS